MKRTAMTKALSFVLTLIMVFVSYVAMPAKALAEDAEETAQSEAIEAYADANDFSQNHALEYSPLIGELSEDRDESIKVFRRADGAKEAVVYSDPIHYLNGETWETIDNTLELVTLEDGTQVYRNKANDFVVSFSPTFNADNLITVESKGHILSWRFAEGVLFAQEEPVKEETEAPEAEVPEEPEQSDEQPAEEPEDAEPVEEPGEEQDDQETPSDESESIEVSEESGQEETETPVEEETEAEDEPEELEEAPSEEPIAEDPEVAETEEETEPEEPEAETIEEPEAEDEPAYETLKITDAKAEVVVREQKEPETDEDRDMLLRFPEELTSELAYVDRASGLNVRYVLSGKRLSEQIVLEHAPENAIAYSTLLTADGLKAEEKDGRIVFVDEAGEVIFEIMAPFMYDANGEECDEIEVRLIETEDGYTYTLIPNEKWLKDESRAYPVIVDPDIQPPFSGTVDDTYISYQSQNSNYNTRDRLKIGGTPHYRTLIKVSGLPTLETGDVIVESTLNLSRYNTSSAYNKEIDLYKVLKTWDFDTVTWSNFQPDSATSVERGHISAVAATAQQNEFNQFDITALVKYWYENPTQNFGVMLESWKESSNWYTEYRSSNYNSTYSGHPYFSIIYVNSTGLENRFTYHSQSAGRAGTGSVNDFSGNLTWTHADASINNGVLPISLSHVYNTNDRTTDIGYGNGWRLNYSQSLTKVELTNRTETTTYYQLIDGDGTRHYYKYSSTNTYVNELDKDSTLKISGTTATIEDKGGNKLVFACDSGLNNGRLTTIQDANGNKTSITYTTSTITNLRISTIQEELNGLPAGQQLTLTYSSNLLSGVTSPDGLNVSYTYSSSNLTGITYADSKTCSFTYSNHCLKQAKNIDNYNLNYTYNSVAPYKVIKVEEKANTTAGQYLTFDYGWNCTTVADKQNRKTIYQFNNGGQAVSVRDPEGRAVFAAYNTAEQTVTQISATSKMQTTVFNLLKNHGFETTSSSGNPWTRSNTSNATFSSTYAHTGKYSLKMVSTSSAAISATQTVSVTAGKTYTFSAYFTGQTGAKLYALNGSTEIAHSDPVPTFGTTGTDWMRGVVTFKVPSGVSSVTLKIELPKTSVGTVYADSAQLEVGSTPNRYNMIQNGDFSDGMTAWTASSHISSSTDGITTDNDDSHPTEFSDSVYHITGTCDYQKYIAQTITVAGKKGDTYSFGAWMRSDSVPLTTQPNGSSTRLYGIKRVSVEFLNGSTVVNSSLVYFNADTNDWQYACGSAVAAGTYTSIRLSLNFHYTRNDCYYDGVQLHREEFSQAYTYDDEGNLTGYTSLIGQENSFEYDDDTNDLISSTDPRGNTTTYTYNDKHNMTSMTSPEGVKSKYTINAKGQVYKTQVGSDSKYIETTTEHGGAAALLTKVIDSRGKEVTYDYDSNTRQNTQITDPKGNTSTYLYGNALAMHRLASLTSTGLGTVEYTYDTYGKLTKIKRGSTEYNLTYNSWNQPISTKVGTTALSTNTYDNQKRLSTVTYANGFSARYVYDNLDRVSQIYQTENNTESLVYEMIYNGEGDLYELRNYRTLRASFFDYDHAGRCMASKERSFTVSGNTISYGSIISSYEYKYDECNNLTKLTCSVLGSVWSTTYTYDKDNRPKKTTLSSGKVITNTYDEVGRLSNRALGLSTTYNTALTYIAGNGSNKTTALVGTYKNGSDAQYVYTYDDNGNITSITQGSTSITYEYDAANRLTRENNQVTNQTVTYEYDTWGNILNKKIYAYTTATNPGTPTSTITYTYGNDTWKDQLTSYNGQTITYDSMGNPTTYRGYTFGWRGKQLTSASNGTNSLTFEYNEDGLRQKKTVNGVDTNYFYNGSVLIGMQRGTSKFLFSYDASGNVVSVNYNGTEYYYLRNAQGDIVKLIDASGATVVEYSYDTWGKKVTTTGTLAGTLGLFQPFRYRGYVYDWETGFYYLQSRYYDPTTGRFISADILLSTGQGVLGHNAYAYCGDNPVSRADVLGNSWEDIEDWIEDKWNRFKQFASKTYDSISGFCVKAAAEIDTILSDLGQDIGNFNLSNTDEEKVLDSHYFSAYKGALVIRYRTDLVTSCSIAGIIWLNKNGLGNTTEKKIQTVKHEYGHILQERILGPVKYIKKIAIPSLTHRDPNGYYNNPWECLADILGGVDRGQTIQTKMDAIRYFISAILD